MSQQSTGNQPSQNPADLGTFQGLFRAVLRKFLQGVDDMLPARVISYDREKNIAQVQPLVAMLTTNNEIVSRARVASVPVFQIGGGNFLLNFNILPGDLGWIKANDRDISLFLQSFNEQAPNTARQHSFQDAVFFPHIMTGYDIDSADSQNCVLQNLDGSVKISLGADKITIKAPHVVIESNDVQINGTSLKHNTKNVGSTHQHSGVQSGGSNTGAPV